ncbi:uncharacterized protein C16orf45 homolog isoform X1 [Centruroides sculpturatus]|uniref:uncharacterized protein C16orf45 homolog isoform X1 n=1 Tax=Centruroides sculpturatus TaxID=218467 RepID=UPI000C6DA6E6|nr:uncharacterized protein C16orf45 homolog isoform X1 [Centruroides sculpturatus]
MYKYGKISSIISLKSLGRECDESCASLDHTCDDESDVNHLYINRIEDMKRILFPATDDILKMSPRARLCIAHVERELFELKMKRNEILRKESELIYTLQDTLLDEECEKLRREFSYLSQISDEEKTAEQQCEEYEILQKIVNIVDERNNLLFDLDIERLREMEEDKEIQNKYMSYKLEWMKLIGSLEDIRSKGNIRQAITRWLEQMGTKFHLTNKNFVN